MKLIQYSTPLSLSQFFLQEPYNDSIVRLINPFTILAVPFIQKSPDLRPFPRVLFVQLIDDPCQGSVTISFQQSVIQIQHFVDFPVIGIVRASYLILAPNIDRAHNSADTPHYNHHSSHWSSPSGHDW